MPILNWLNKGQAVTTAKNCDYRLLEEVPALSYGDTKSENLLIQGDNLEALKALIPFYAGKMKCIYIDPPYNTGSAFQHYDDNLEHSKWLSMMYPRLDLLRDLLADDGFICCQIDDAESHYLKVILDEVFGRNNYQTSLYFQVRYANKTLAEDSDYHKVIEQCFVYSKGGARPNKVKQQYSIDKFEWKIIEKEAGEKIVLGGKKSEIFKPGQYEIQKIPASYSGLKETWATGSLIKQKKSSGEFLHLNIAPRKEIDGLSCLYKVDGIGEDGLGHRYFTGPKKATATKGKFYSGIPLKTLKNLKLGEAIKELPIPNFYDFSGNFGNCRLEGDADFRSGKKPEAVLSLILEHFSEPNDWVLDSFLGSGSTAATAHKMGRRYIGIEIGEHAVTHCQPRLQKVIDGEQGGISKDVEWTGGGGFKFVRLGQTVFDEYGCLNPDIRFATLAAHIWYLETKQPMAKKKRSAYLGVHGDEAYYLLYNGILGDRRPDGGNVLTSKVIKDLPSFDEHLKNNRTIVIYGESTRLGEARLRKENITFKQIPYDVGAL